MLLEAIIYIVQVLFLKQTFEALVLLLLIRKENSNLSVSATGDIFHKALLQVKILKHFSHQERHIRRRLLWLLLLLWFSLACLNFLLDDYHCWLLIPSFLIISCIFVFFSSFLTFSIILFLIIDLLCLIFLGIINIIN